MKAVGTGWSEAIGMLCFRVAASWAAARLFTDISGKSLAEFIAPESPCAAKLEGQQLPFLEKPIQRPFRHRK